MLCADGFINTSEIVIFVVCGIQLAVFLIKVNLMSTKIPN